MDEIKRHALEAAGFRVADAEDFLGMTPDERKAVRLRRACQRIRRALEPDNGIPDGWVQYAPGTFVQDVLDLVNHHENP